MVNGQLNDLAKSWVQPAFIVQLGGRHAEGQKALCARSTKQVIRLMTNTQTRSKKKPNRLGAEFGRGMEISRIGVFLGGEQIFSAGVQS